MVFFFTCTMKMNQVLNNGKSNQFVENNPYNKNT